jgi:anti-sigma regulatory factor (Ser/Thr protein kinase)
MKDISMHIMDILQNSTRAGAKTIELDLHIDTKKDTLAIIFKDDGCGMNETTMSKALNPFFTTRTTRDVGLGLSLLKQNAELTGGTLSMTSALGVGTTVTAVMGYSHIDRQPLGDIAGTVVLTASAYPDIRFIFHYRKDETDYTFDTQEINEALDGLSIQQPEIIQYLREMVEENIKM